MKPDKMGNRFIRSHMPNIDQGMTSGNGSGDYSKLSQHKKACIIRYGIARFPNICLHFNPWVIFHSFYDPSLPSSWLHDRLSCFPST